jgi:hypothetical protein
MQPRISANAYVRSNPGYDCGSLNIQGILVFSKSRRVKFKGRSIRVAPGAGSAD